MTRRIITWAGIVVAVIALAVVLSSAWNFSTTLRDELLAPGPAVGVGSGGDPQTALGRSYLNVDISTELGPAPAWVLAPDSESWLIYVHGAGGRAEVFDVADAALDAGFGLMTISYRNDGVAPATSDGLVSWGFDEWRDVDAAINFALEEGVSNVFLMGSGLGASAVLVTLEETTHIRSIRAVILESPVLDLASVEEAREPDAGFIGSWGRVLASWRFGVEWSRLDHVDRADEVRRPVLLLAAGLDETTPVELAAAFADAAGDRVELHVIDGAGHGQVPDVVPQETERLIRNFLVEHLPTPG